MNLHDDLRHCWRCDSDRLDAFPGAERPGMVAEERAIRVTLACRDCGAERMTAFQMPTNQGVAA